MNRISIDTVDVQTEALERSSEPQWPDSMSNDILEQWSASFQVGLLNSEVSLLTHDATRALNALRNPMSNKDELFKRARDFTALRVAQWMSCEMICVLKTAREALIISLN